MFSDSSISRTAVEPERSHRRHQPIERVGGRRQQLPGRARVAHLVAVLAEEPEPVAAQVEAGAHPVALLGRTGHGQRRRQLEAADAPERVGDHLRLERELARVGDVAVEAAAAQRIGKRIAPIRGRLVDRQRLRIDDALADPLDACLHALAGNRVGHQHDLAGDARDHPPARGWLLDRDRNGLAL